MIFNLDIIEQDLEDKDIPELADSGFDIYDHYKLKNYYMLDTNRDVYWKAVFLYHTSRGWDIDGWANTATYLKETPNIVSVQVNFVKPNSVVPLHRDQYNGIECVTTILCIRGDNIKFYMDGETKILNTGDIISLDGVNCTHGLNNDSTNWFVGLVIDTLK